MARLTLKAVVTRLCGFTLFLGACVLANTPQQDLAYARWAKCDSPSAVLARVDLDGRITFKFTSPGVGPEIRQCLADAGRGGPQLPEPVAIDGRAAGS